MTFRRYSSQRTSITRRSGVLQIGQLIGLGALTPTLLPAVRSEDASSGKMRTQAKSCVLIWLDGGPSHLETFDLKPSAPQEVRGPLSAIQTAVPGVSIGECLPQTAKLMRDVAVIRSMTSPLGEHNLGTHYMLSGFKPTPALEYPSFSTVANFRLGTTDRLLPGHVAIPDVRVGGAAYRGLGYLPPSSGAFAVGGDPASDQFAVRNMTVAEGLTLDRIERRRQFAEQIARWSAGADSSVPAEFDQAFRMVTSPEAAAAFALEEEPSDVRRRYGPKTIGQSCLLARRLVERGVNYVTVTNRGWDTHQDLTTRLKDGFRGSRHPVGLIPSLDLAVSSLIHDLKDRRLLDETLVVVMGEFGRTPKLNPGGGRDHWPRVFSVMMAGGGVVGGQVIGASDSVGESPADRPVTPSDLVATIYTLLGIDPQLELTTPDRRPVRLTPAGAQVVRELTG
ncbi:MAG: DUF1501 domain-containing protein [Planctomycetaceae bacterium]|nr:DUF1501 domain-containing protein [Planctomycetaceae bacterium]